MINRPTKFVLLAFYLFSCVQVYATISDEAVAEKLDEIKKLRSENPSQALGMITDLLSFAELSNDNRGELYYEHGYTLKYQLNKKDEALISLYKALRYFRQSNNIKSQYKTLRILGHTFNDLNHHTYAIDYYNEILSLDLASKKSKLYTRYNIARTYRLKEDYDTAIAIQKELLSEFEKEDMIIDVIDCHLEIGVSYIGLENWSEAKEHYNRVLELTRSRLENKRYISKANVSLGFIALKENELDKKKNVN